MTTILLTDDDEGVLFTLGEILEDAGYAVRRARSGGASVP